MILVENELDIFKVFKYKMVKTIHEGPSLTSFKACGRLAVGIPVAIDINLLNRY